MNSPWINMRPVRPKEMKIFKVSTLRRLDKSDTLNLKNEKEDHTETGNDTREVDNTSTNTPDAEENNSFKLEEFVGEIKKAPPVELTKGVNIYEQGKVCYMTKNSQFSVHVEIDDFLHDPICGDITQNTFEYHDMNDKNAPVFDTKLFSTTTYYPEKPEYRLVCSNIHEIVFLSNDQNEVRNKKGNHNKSVVVPMHNSLFTQPEKLDNNSYMHIRVPVLLGEYKIEICLEENVSFIEEITRINEISKEIVITDFRLVPTVFSQPLNNGTRILLKGNLFIDGYIRQKITYISFPNNGTGSVTPLNHLSQKVVVELIIHILQTQQVQVIR